ncbi:hypothetical protein MMC28_004360 [Mycoblastus sanguinarius]|nr:hypothetical protein [Mycoblastus sanguinarius]
MPLQTHIHKQHKIPFFRIFYSTTFTALTLVLAALVLITPGDHIYQSFRTNQIYHIFIVAGVYLLVLLVAIFIYAGRLYATRSVLAAIPKEASPLERANAGRAKVRRVVREGLERSAIIAFDALPRDLGDEKARRNTHAQIDGALPSSSTRRSQDSAQSTEPVWGTISHPGWTSPSSPDLPNLHYDPVILELSHLIEAKAVSLAPKDPLYDPPSDLEASDAPAPDPVAVELLQRPAAMGLRDYITHLSTLSMIAPTSLGNAFLALYEYARFSGEALTEEEFRALMGIFAEILRNMQPLDAAIIEEFRAEALGSSSSSTSVDDTGSIATNETVQRTPQPDAYSSSSSTSASRKGSRGTIETAPPRPRAASGAMGASQRRGVHTPSLASLRRLRSNTSFSGISARSVAGSVIRLAEASGPLDLPYSIDLGSPEGI